MWTLAGVEFHERDNPVLVRQEIGRRLRAAREAAGLTVLEAAALLEIGDATVGRTERGVSLISAASTGKQRDVAFLLRRQRHVAFRHHATGEESVRTFAIIIERAEDGGYGAWSPDLPGCIAVGDDQDECLTLMKEAIEFHLDGMRQDGEPIPEPSTVAATTFTTTA